MTLLKVIATVCGVGNTHSARAVVGAITLRVTVAKVTRSSVVEVRDASRSDRLEKEIVLAILLVKGRSLRQVTCLAGV